MLEAEKVYSIAFAPLVTMPFAVEWTPDNLISIITEKGVHIFELAPSPMCPDPNIKFSRSFIYPSDTLPAYAFKNEIDSMIWNMKREEIYSLLMEISLTPKISEINDMIPKITSICWSPQNLIYPSKCMLAILTSAGAIELLQQVSRNWLSVCDLSSYYLDTLRENIKSKLQNCVNEDTRFTIIKENIRQVQACAMTWSELYKLEDISFAYLVTAYYNSDIIIWKIPRIQNYCRKINPLMVSKIHLDISTKINALNWITIDESTYLIIVSYFNGQISGLKYVKGQECLENKSVEKYYTCADRIAVSSLHVVSQDEFNIKFIAFKGIFLLLFSLTSTGTLKSYQYLQMDGFAVTGVTTISFERILITTQDSIIYEVDIKNDCLNTVKHNLPQARVQYLGLAHSPTCSMFINVTSPNSTYDHLIKKEPSTMNIFILHGELWDPLQIINKITEENSELPWDCLELIRLKAAKTLNLINILPDGPSQCLKSLNLYKLRISMWISVMNEVLKKKTMTQGIGNMVGEIAEAQPLIFINSACSYLKNLMNRNQLSKEQKLSINLLRMYLEVYLAGKDDEEETIITKRVQEAMYITSHLSSMEVELCNLCNTPIAEVPWNATKCSLGHMLSRCALTLLQITTVEYLYCPICRQMFHSCLSDIYEDIRCLFCNVPVLYDYRVVNPQNSGTNLKNLSVPQICNVESSKNHESEASVHTYVEDKLCKNKKYPITINHDEDESCNITETWGEL